MTRLNTSDIDGISSSLLRYDMELKKTVGYTLEEIAKHAVGLAMDHKIQEKLKIAVVPVTSGLGIISGFSETVRDILKHCDLHAYVTETTDVAGIQEAYRTGADVIFIADDHTCSAFSLQGKVYSDNGHATGIAFSAALELMMENVENEEVLILGAGPVGKAAVEYFASKHAVPVLHDIQREKMKGIAEKVPEVRIENGPVDLKKYKYILDATTGEGFIGENDVKSGTKISAPGMPLGVKKDALKKVDLFHNPLETGILTMFFHCIKQREGQQS